MDEGAEERTGSGETQRDGGDGGKGGGEIKGDSRSRGGQKEER